MFHALSAELRRAGLALTMIAGLGLSACGGGGTTGTLNNTNMTGNPTSANPFASKAASLPLTFDDSSVNYNASPVEGGSGTVTADPAGGTAHGMVFQVTIIGQSTYDGIVLASTGNGLASAVGFSSTVSQLKADIYSPTAGVPVLLKAETLDGKSCTATLATTTASKAWETLTFEFKNSIDAGTGCTAPDTSKQYVRLIVLPNYGTKVSSAQNYFFDNVTLGGTTNLTAATLPLSFDTSGMNYGTASIAAGSGSVTADPAGSGTRGNVLKISTGGAAASTYDGVTLTSLGAGLGAPVGFTSSIKTMTVDVYSPKSGVPFLLKGETADGTSCTAALASTTQANTWETLTFNFSNASAGGCTPVDTTKSYVKLSVFPNFGTSDTTGSSYYVDNLALGTTAAPPPAAAGSTGNCTSSSTVQCYAFSEGGFKMAPFSDLTASVGNDPVVVSPANVVVQLVTTAASNGWGGATLDPKGTGVNTIAPLVFGSSKVVTLRAYSAKAGVPVLLKFESSANAGDNFQIAVNTTVANQWETLSFDFSTIGTNNNSAAFPFSSGTYDATKTYDRVSIFPDFALTDPKPNGAQTYYFDELNYPTASTTPPAASSGSTGNCTSTSTLQCYAFSESGFKMAPFSDLAASIGNDLVVVSPANVVVQLVTTASSNGWGGATLDPKGTSANTVAPLVFGSSKVVTLRSYSPRVGVPVLLKFESSANAGDNFQIAVKTTVANQWETLSFDFTTIGTNNNAAAFPFSSGTYDATKTYDRVSIFPDFATTDPKPNGAQTYYFDELTYGTTTATSSSVFPLASGSGTALVSGKYASDYLATQTGEAGDWGFYADGANTVQWWAGNGALASPTADPNMYFGFGAKAATTYMGGFVKAPANGTARMTGYTQLRMGIWGNDELTSRKPTYKVILKGAPVAGGCQPEVAADVTNTVGIGATYYTVAFTSLVMRQDCGSFANVAAVLTAGINEVHAQLLPPNMQFTTGGDPSGFFPNGLNIGTITFLP